MLTIYIKGQTLPEGLDIREDAELEFARIRVTDTEYNRKAIKEIEEGEYYSDDRFIDRFDRPLFLNNLSTGCKAALVVGNNPDIVLDLKECGLNAIDFIVANCNTGNILIKYPTNNIGLVKSKTGYSDTSIDVIFDDGKFTNTRDLNHYIEVLWPFYHPEAKII